MTINIKKENMKDKKTFCKKCRSFLFKSKENGYIEFKSGLDISSNGEQFIIKCSCGDITVVNLK